MFFKIVDDGFVVSCGKTDYDCNNKITETEYAAIMQKIRSKPTDPEGYTYKLRADNLEWELAELPPDPEYEPTEADKAEAYDILTGVSE